MGNVAGLYGSAVRRRCKCLPSEKALLLYCLRSVLCEGRMRSEEFNLPPEFLPYHYRWPIVAHRKFQYLSSHL